MSRFAEINDKIEMLKGKLGKATESRVRAQKVEKELMTEIKFAEKEAREAKLLEMGGLMEQFDLLGKSPEEIKRILEVGMATVSSARNEEVENMEIENREKKEESEEG